MEETIKKQIARLPEALLAPTACGFQKLCFSKRGLRP